MLLGVWLLWSHFLPNVTYCFGRGWDISDTGVNVLQVIILPLIALPGLLSLGFGIALFRLPSLTSLKCVIGLFLCIGGHTVSGTLSFHYQEFFSDPTHSGLMLPASVCIVATIYIFLVRHLSRRLGLGTPNMADLFGRGILALMALSLHITLNYYFMEYSRHQRHQDELSLFILYLMPYIIPYLTYRLAVKRLQVD